MPINYAPPQPYNPGVSAAYGAAEEFNKLAPTLEAHQANQAHNYAQMYLAAGQSRDQMVGIAAQRGVQEQLAAANINQRNQEVMAQRDMHTESLDAHTADIQLQGMLQGQAVSQQEQVRMQRMQSAIGDVMSDETMTPEMKRDLVMQLKTGIDPIRQRQEQAQLVTMQKQNQLQDEQIKNQAAHAETYKKLATGNFKPIPLGDEDNPSSWVVPTPDGKWQEFKNPNAKEAKEKAIPDYDKIPPAVSITQHLHDAAKLFKASFSPEAQASMSDDAREGWIDTKAKQIQYNYEQERARKIAEHEAKYNQRNQKPVVPGLPPQAPVAPSANIGGTPTQATPEAPQAPPPPESLKNPFRGQGATAELKPFQAHKPDTMDESQKTLAEALVGAHDEINSGDLDLEEKDEGRGHAATALHLLQDFGSREAMPFSKRREFDAAFQAANHFLIESQRRTKGRPESAHKPWINRMGKGRSPKPDWGNW